MVFSSLLFLGLFLPLLLAVYHLTPRNITVKNIILLAASLLFYAWGEPVKILLLLASALAGYLGGVFIERFRGRAGAKVALIASLAFLIGALMLFKYTGFFVSNVNVIFGTEIEFAGFALPLGISFYTFQILSYVIDVYRGRTTAQRSYYKLLLYVSLFPQLVAGPIVRYIDVEAELNHRTVTLDGFFSGIVRFTQGLLKKVILANYAGSAVNTLLDGNLATQSALGAWVGILMFTFQIYFDFSGYSDMAIGIGRMFGFNFLENFNYPYVSTSITEFWRRWHMSLGGFFRDYVYIPLGGNRRHQLLNLIIVWFLTGFWHGASWNFILWGLYYGALLIFEKKVLFKFFDKVPIIIRRVYTLAAVVGGWILFYFTDMGRLKGFMIVALGRNAGANSLQAISVLRQNAVLIVLLAVFSTPILRVALNRLRERLPRVYAALMPTACILGLWVCFTLLISQSYNPFLYFRF